MPLQAQGSALLLALGLVLSSLPGRRSIPRHLAVACLSLAAAMNGLAVLGTLSGPETPLSRWLIRTLFDFTRLSPLTVLAQFGSVLALALTMGFLGKKWGHRQAGALAACIPLSLGAVVVLSYLAGAPLWYGVLAVPMSLGAGVSALLLGMGLLLNCGRDTWPMAIFSYQTSGTRPLNWLLSRPLTVFLALTLLILAGGSGYRRVQLAKAQTIAQEKLSTIADQKVERIAHWHGTTVLEAQQVFHGALVQNQLKRFLANAAGAPSQAELLGWMNDFKDRGYGAVTLFDRQGRCRLSTSEQPDPLVHQPYVQAALRAGKVTEVDLHRDQPGGGVHLSLLVPIGADPVSQALAQGVLLLKVEAEGYLFTMLRTWPTPSPTGETLLVRREGSRVVFLNGQRHSQVLPLEGSLNLVEHPDTPAVQAVTGGPGFVTGADYRGVPVMAALRQVPGTAWWMVSKLDEAELSEPIRLRNNLIVTSLMAAVLLLALGIGLLLRNYDNRQILGELDQERERKTLAERFQQLMHQANDIILLMDVDGRLLEANDRAAEAYGYTLAELEQMNIRDLRASDSRPEVEGSLQEFAQGTLTRVETWHRRRDGSTFPVEVSARPVHFGAEKFLLSFVRDITERHSQAQALQRMTQLYVALSQVNQAIVWSTSPQELFTKISQVLVEFGRFRMVWIGQHDTATHTVLPLCHAGAAQDYFHAIEVRTDESPQARGPVGTALRENRPCLFNNFLEAPETTPWHRQAAKAGFASAAAFPVGLEGEPRFVLAVYAEESNFFGEEEMALLAEAALDLSFALGHLAQEAHRTSAEEALRQSEARLKTLTECAPDLIFMLDALGQVCYLNRPVPGLPLKDVLGQDWLQWFPQDDRGLAQAAQKAALASGQSQEFEARSPGANGQLRWYRVRISPILGAERGEAMVVFATDITEARKALADQFQLQAQLAQSQKLESLGSLAGGVAHDMNNVLGAILSLASAHREKLDPSDPFATSLDTIIGACLRGRGVVKSLLYFAHKDLEQVSAINVNALVQEMVQLLAYTTLKRINLAMNLQDGIGTLHGDSGALSHTLMNLCVNAMDAMPGGGSLTISTDRLQDGRLQLRVQDTGSGMSKEVQEKALEPFYTTKPQGKGTGLGLSMAYATMQAHDGNLEIRSVPDVGTQILLTFPASRMSGLPEPALPVPSVSTEAGGPWRLLLVDDDDLIRNSVAPMLEILGHQVTCAPGGLEALALLEKGLEVDLAILDMNMPGLNGADTLPLVLALRPAMPVLMATGYSDQDLAGLLENRPNVFSIRKPFSLAEIRDKFREILG